MKHPLHIVDKHGEWLDVHAPNCNPPIAFSVEKHHIARVADTLKERCGVDHELHDNGKVTSP